MKPDDVLSICTALTSRCVACNASAEIRKVWLCVKCHCCSVTRLCGLHGNAITLDIRLEPALPFYNFLCSTGGLISDMKLGTGDPLSC